MRRLFYNSITIILVAMIMMLGCSKHPTQTRVSCIALQSDFNDPLILFADLFNESLENKLSSDFLVYPLDWYYYSLDKDSLSNLDYMLTFAKRIGLDRLITIQHSDQGEQYKIIVHNLSVYRIEIEQKYRDTNQLLKNGFSSSYRQMTGDLSTFSLNFPEMEKNEMDVLTRARVASLNRHYQKADSLYSKVNSRAYTLLKIEAQINYEITRTLTNPQLNASLLNAESQLKEKLQNDSLNPRIYRNIARIKIVQKRFNDAYQILTTLLSRKPDDAEGLFLASFLNQRRIQKLGYDSKEKLLKQVIRLNPAGVDAYLALGGMAYFKLDTGKAIKIYHQLLEMNPRSIDGLMALGRIHLVQNEFLKLIPIFEKVLAINPGYADAYYNLGIAYYNNEKIDLAIQFFEKAIDLANHENSYLYLGFIYYKLGKNEKAIQYYRNRMHLSKHIDDPFAEEARKQLVKLLYYSEPAGSDTNE